ncbi:hypothetical protein QWJ41_13240 [Nocardioides sp. SOB44]|uniref:Uncharacterized protein n=1 Tax=Nocardioides cremeus TaxID=3058044 RepID=A0ABT8TU51_9ACTN|nr:hypothetical protein [Nocardioides cremeus]MDO3396688.1 hypothetical protein [Nocardioides cremeus]
MTTDAGRRLPPVLAPSPAVPFGVAWLSDDLYRVTAGSGRAGEKVEVDGWDDALDTAWRQLVGARPGIPTWVDDYLRDESNDGLNVTFGDTSRVVGRRGYGCFNVSYPAALILAHEDRVSAMRAAILVVLDRHVDRCDLHVPPLSSLIDAH